MGQGQLGRQAVQQQLHRILGRQGVGEAHHVLAGHQEIQDRAQRVDIGGWRELAADELLGGGEVGGTHEGTHARDVAVQAAGDLGDPEVGHTAVRHLGGQHLFGQKHIFRLEIAVHDAALVGFLERPADLASDLRGDSDRQGPHTRQVVVEAAATLEGRDEVRRGAWSMDEAQVLHDVGVVQLLEDLGLGVEAAHIGTMVAGREQDLDGHLGPDGLVSLSSQGTRDVGDASAPLREAPLDAVVPIEVVARDVHLTPALGRLGALTDEVGALVQFIRKRRQTARAVQVRTVG